MESSTEEGDSPVVENIREKAGIPSTTRHVKSSGNLGGPPPKAKYYLATDSELVP